MSWSWSHTGEAYDNARQNVHNLDDETLAVIYAEWKASRPVPHQEHAFMQNRYPLALLGAQRLIARGMREAVADAIWDWMSELATCTNGGYEAWCCPFGCAPHRVGFDLDRDGAIGDACKCNCEQGAHGDEGCAAHGCDCPATAESYQVDESEVFNVIPDGESEGV